MKKLTIPIQFYATEEDEQRLIELSRKTQLSKSKVLRLLLRSCKLTEAPPADYKKLIREIRTVGNNLNQILFTARTKCFVDIPYLKTEINELREVEKSIRDEFKIKVTERNESGSSKNLGY